MTFDEQMVLDADNIFSVFGKAAKYCGLDVMVIPEIGSGNSKTVNSESRYEMASFSVRASEVPEPKAGDSIVYQGKEWQYDCLVESDGIVHVIQCLGDESSVILR